MKISIGAVFALTAASVSGFSITMSSYLDNLATQSTLTSFAPQGGGATTYAPAPSYAAPAPANGASFAPAPPAPAPYTSSFADLPASNSLNYIATIGGGSQMKSGPNYTGMSRSFQPSNDAVSGSVYLSNLKGASVTSFANGATAPAAPAQNSFAPAPAQSYAPAPPAPAPYQSSFAEAPATTATGYIGTIGGGSQMKPGPNYTGMSSSFKPTSSISNSVYLDNVNSIGLSSFTNGATAPANGYSAPAPFAAAPAPPAPYQSSFAPAPAPAYASSPPSYAGSSSYMPQPSGRVTSTGIGSYLDAL